MRKALCVVFGLLLCVVAAHTSYADSTWELSVQASATVQTAPPQITLNWPQDTYSTPSSYTIYRKAPGVSSWGNGVTLSGTATEYVDTSVNVGSGYEYQIVKKAAQYTGYGYIYAGISLPLVENRGKLLLVIENTYSAQLTDELARLRQDLVGDGWTVIPFGVDRKDSVASVKEKIRAQYTADPAGVKAVFLFGRVPVPYSGDIVPDGHAPEHHGAWPCDAFYGDMDGVWTDGSVNRANASEARNRNVPGDGKYDQSSFPAAIRLMVGRVDLANMPGRLTWGGPATFPSELELLRNYLNKDHKFRQKQFNLPRKAYVGDFFGYRDGEAFAASGWRNFAGFFGADNISHVSAQGTWVSMLSQNPVLAAYGCGAGTYTSVAGLGSSGIYNDALTTEIVNNDIKTVFALMFGSWLGDWDSEDNLLRGILALPSYGLASAWSGRPHWFLHHMALGEPIGYGARLTQNNTQNGLYRNQVNSCAGQIHIALMGDPTLRLHTVAPPGNVTASPTTGGSLVTWTSSSEAVDGYYVYSAPDANSAFTRRSATLVAGVTYVDVGATGSEVYMVRAAKLETSASGTYWNASQGAFSTAAGTGVVTVPDNTTSNVVVAMPTNTPAPQTPPPSTPTGTTLTTWVEDGLPAGAKPGADGGDYWNWILANPEPVAGSASHQSSVANGLHQHYFTGATQTLKVDPADVLHAHVYLDPANPPSAIMLQWSDGSWEHRAYWGANLIQYGTDGTAGRRYMGPLPAVSRWVRLEVPASQVGLEGSTITGMAFSQYNGRAAWDSAGKLSSEVPVTPPNTNTNSVNITNIVAWFDDELPSGAVSGSEGGDSWNWASANPTPFSGSKASQSISALGLHQMYFASAAPLSLGVGDTLVAHVYLDPASPPNELMVQWNDGSWEHRAYWGANLIGYGTYGTAGRRYMGPLPKVGQWSRLEVPANLVGLDARQVTGIAFTLYNGRAAWDLAGKLTVLTTNTPTTPPATNNPPATVTNTPPPVANTNQTPATTNLGSIPVPGVSTVDYLTLELPKPGDSSLHVLTPNLLELKLINTKDPDPARVMEWDFVDANGNLIPPALSSFFVRAGGRQIAVTGLGFRRRPLYAPFNSYDLRIDNSLFLQLAEPVSDDQVVEVLNPDGTVWPAGRKFSQKTDPLRFSPAIHVNQEGYIPSMPKKAMVGYYAGSLGEMPVPSSSGFKLVDAHTGDTVFTGSLRQRPDSGYTYTPTPYQKVYEADFTTFNTPGEYRLVVPGMGGSVPFLIDHGITMSFARAYALGLYHQRCGTSTTMPHTRHTHDDCHLAAAAVPASEAEFPFTWKTVADYARKLSADNSPQTAPALVGTAAQLFPFQRLGQVDASGGHHDAGDYSKYTANSANLIHYLMFAVDSLPGVGALDNLGLPESGDGISDILQEAKWEADFLAKLQDTDGGFYFLVYPRNREYESGVPPEKGDAQVVWPKTTSATAAAVAALAQCASSPTLKRTYPETAAKYLAQAKLGWQFLLSAITKHGRTGAYQKITHYGDTFTDQDELAWAACQMFLATGDQSIHSTLRTWFDPSDAATWRWGWWHMAECYGHAVRSYAFATVDGRLPSTAIDADYLAKCEGEILTAGDAATTWSKMNAYGTSFPDATKRVKAAGWYFSTDQAFDIAVAYQFRQKPEYLQAILGNLNYEGGCNPVNVSYVTGLGWKRQRDIVHQWAATDRQALPPSGIPVGNIQANFGWLWAYGGMLSALCFPSDSATVAPYPFYDRWGDSWNVSAEFVILNSARSLGCLAFLAAQGPLKSQPWKPVQGTVTVPSQTVELGEPVTVSLTAPGIDLAGARVVWEARDQEPTIGNTFTFTPRNNGTQWVEAEAHMPDGRRVFATATFSANSSDIVWCDDAVPAGATTGAEGGDSWSWNHNAPFSGTASHVSAAAAGAHQHFFSGAASTLALEADDILYAWVFLNPTNPPAEIMLQWNDGNWNHRAYWGANLLGYGVDGTEGRRYMGPQPEAGKWVQLKVPAKLVGLEGRTVNGMAFSLYSGQAAWDRAGRLSSDTAQTTSVSVQTTATASRVGSKAGAFRLVRTGPVDKPLTLEYSLGGTATKGLDYQQPEPAIIPAGSDSVSVNIVPLPSTDFVGPSTVELKLLRSQNYDVLGKANAELVIAGNIVRSEVSLTGNVPTVSWDSTIGGKYRVAYKNSLTDQAWAITADLTATSARTTWRDTQAQSPGRYYVVAQTD